MSDAPTPKRILVASLNPVKIAATLTAFTTMFPTETFIASVSTKSPTTHPHLRPLLPLPPIHPRNY